MKRIGWIIGALLGVMAIVGIGFYVSGNQTDTVIVPQAINQASDDSAQDQSDDSSSAEDSSVNSSDDSSSSSVEDDYELYGTLVSLTKEDVTISFNGKESTYRLAQTHEIDDDTPQVGDRVKLELNRNDEVKEVDRESGDDDTPRVGDRVKLELNRNQAVIEVDNESDDDQYEQEDSSQDDSSQDDSSEDEREND